MGHELKPPEYPKYTEADPYADAKKWWAEGKLQFKLDPGWTDWSDYCGIEPRWKYWKPSDFRRKPEENCLTWKALYYKLDEDVASSLAAFINRHSDIKASVEYGTLALCKKVAK